MLKKSGFVVLAGRSNVGKSTLLNSLVGTKIAITTPKPQTTRHLIQGVLHDERGQIVFIDTPGIFAKSKDAMTSRLTSKAKEAFEDVDLILYIVDPTRAIGNEEKIISRLVLASKIPKILVINKIDLDKKPFLEEYRDWQSKFNAMIEISAYRKKHLQALINLVFTYLKEGEPYYPAGQVTNIENKFWFSELIREKIFLLLSQEIPYTTQVEVEEIEERCKAKNPEEKILYIKAMIYTTHPRYKKMLIGRGGRKIKEIGQLARKEMEQATDQKVFLDLEVKVEERWQERFV